MLDLAEIFRRHWPDYQQRFGAQLLPSHRQAVAALLSCRTPPLGGQVYRCECGATHYAYHSCHHRACPKCGHAQASHWLARQRCRLLPVPYFLVTFTVPQELRALWRSHQRLCYDLHLRESAAAKAKRARIAALLGWRAPSPPARQPLPAPLCPCRRRPMLCVAEIPRAPP